MINFIWNTLMHLFSICPKWKVNDFKCLFIQTYTGSGLLQIEHLFFYLIGILEGITYCTCEHIATII